MDEQHDWDVSPAEARRIQKELAARVSLESAIELDQLSTVAGVDNAYATIHGEKMVCAAVVMLSFPALEIIETAISWRPSTFPYVPGLLSFREVPAILAAYAGLRTLPDVILCDGQGYAHPRRFGLASHLGVILDRPTIGCAKSRLVGHFVEPKQRFGAHTPLVDREEVIGAVLRTRVDHPPLFVSPGHRISVAAAVDIVLACCHEGEFMPIPTRFAHETVTHEKKARLAAA